MSVGFIVCPGCQNLLLPDTAQCPTCHHVLDETRLTEAPVSEPQERSDGEQEVACKSCGEMVRVGLVRCWNCSEFMRDDIADAYRKMKSSPQPVIYSQLPDEDDKADTPLSAAAPATDDTFSAGDDDFELDDDDGFEFDGGFSTEAPAAQQTAIPLSDSDDHNNPAPANPAPVAPEPDTIPLAKQDDESETIPLALPAADDSGDDAAVDEVPEIAPLEGDSDSQSTSAQPAAAGSDSSASGESDDLLDVALQEEVENKKRRSQRRKAAGAIIVFCPNGHRIEVQERHRGKTGKCPRCKSRFLVPEKPAESEQPEETQEQQVATKPSEVGVWLIECQMHQVDPTKLRLKPGSLQTSATQVDVWLQDDQMCVIQLTKAGLFGSGTDAKSRTAAREKMRAELDEQIPLSDVSAAQKWELSWDELKAGIKIVQPTMYAHESMFAGIPVFGEYRIGVRVPLPVDAPQQVFLSMELTNFRRLSEQLAEKCGLQEFGAAEGIPLTDSVMNVACHYSEQLMKPLENAAYYNVDPLSELELIGWKCEGCGLVVSEDSRKKEKIGGASGKGIAKAKCPKCKQKFGNHPLHRLVQPEQPAAGGEADAEDGAADT